MAARKRAAADRSGQRLNPEALAVALADGLTVRELAAAFGVPRSTVGDWKRRPDVRSALERELSWRARTLVRFRLRHVEAAFDFAAKVARGEAKIDSPEQFEILRYFMGWGDSAVTAPALDPSTIVHVHVSDDWLPAVPRVILD